jgi:amino acid adenylation domain-containing protein
VTAAHAPTRIPRWTPPGPPPEPLLAHQVVPLPADLTALAAARSVDIQTALLAALVKALSVVTARRQVVVGYLAASSPEIRQLVLEVSGGTWRELVDAASAGQARLAEAEPIPAGTHEIVLDLSGCTGGRPAEPAADTVLQVSCVVGEHPEVRLHHRIDIIDAGYASRLGHYIATALRQLLDATDGAHDHQDLISDAEREHHVNGLAGPVEPLPDTVFTRLFEQRVRANPALPAVTGTDASWDYRTLNAAANRVAAALLAHGLRAEDVVAVVLDRTPQWAAAVLGVLKAGGAYLPVRPDFPAKRVATQLDLSDSSVVLGQRSASGVIDAAVRESGRSRTVLLVEDVLADDTDPGNPDVEVRPGQLAYVYFTSGSTGAPKGAQCEHAGMLNHLLAKIESVDLSEGDVVSQTASQCFDISLWQLIAPLLVGAATHLIDTPTQLDPVRFLDELAHARVSVAQLVPSYFEILLGVLEHWPRDLGRLRSISVTGEALKTGPVQRWFAVQPSVRLVNAYGTTEVSDDTMHEVLDGPPVREFVSVGRSLRNVRTYIVDDSGRLAPLGTPGEIVFSGVCVGRGYINDEARTKEAFVPDPFVAGATLYRTGDFGRWLPEGTIEFLGRRDQQVKIRGYRIEIGEIENKLLDAPGVHACAVVVDTGGAAHSLAAFVAAPAEVRETDLRVHLAALLPEYMVPATIHRLDSLPLNENGKVNKRMLTELAETLGRAGGSRLAPATPTERWLATEWAEALGVRVERIGRDDDFFTLGGTSLTAVRLVVKLDKAISLKQLIGTPVLSTLAGLIDSGAESSSPELLQPLTDPLPDASATLVCFPYAGGNAVNFRALAVGLRAHGIAVYGVELPAHDLTGTQETLQEVAEIARRVRDEIVRLGQGPVLLWGHCAGAAHALATARLLETAGVDLRAVFLGALLFDSVAALEAEQREVSALTARELTERLLGDSVYVELDGLKPERAEVVGSAYRHDVRSANDHLLAIHEEPVPHRITVPVHVVVAADDRSTPDYRTRYLDWTAIGDQVELHSLAAGGHYFTSTRAAETAALIASVHG